MATWYDPIFAAGAVLTGKWSRGQYVVERKLGEGANGRVYLVRQGAVRYALKAGFDAADLQSEANVLKSVDRSRPRDPLLVVQDDFTYDSAATAYPCYIMKYIEGLPLQEFFRKNSDDWFSLIGYHILCRLSELHSAGWVFGDLKLDNVIVGPYGQVELIDYGGVTAKGRSVKQFTEIYDRAYWSDESRTADEGFDLFAFAVLCLHCCGEERLLALSKQLLPQNRSVDCLADLVRTSPRLKHVEKVLLKALRGRYRSSAEACKEWHAVLHRPTTRLVKEKVPQRLWLKGMFAGTLVVLLTTLIYMINSSLTR